MKRKRRKPRLKGTACVLGKRCVATEDYRGFRLCIKHAADMMMADLVKDEEGQCRRCGATESLQWAHVFSRRYASTRWLYGGPEGFSNSMALCAACHYYMTGRPAEWEQWCRDQGIDWDSLRYHALNGPPMQPGFVVQRLRPSTHTEESGG